MPRCSPPRSTGGVAGSSGGSASRSCIPCCPRSSWAGRCSRCSLRATAFIHDQQRAAALSRAVEQSRLPDGTLVKAPDGTPIPKRWIDARNGNRQVDNWGTPLSFYPDKNLIRNYSDNPAVKYVGKFATRLSCGSKCASASGPTSAGEAANAPKQLSSVQIARNALSQALAARALLKFVGKVGVVVDEGVDGLIDALTPEPPAMSDQDRQFARALKQALAKELRQRIRAEAFNRVTDALQRVNAARAKWIKFGDQAVDAGEDWRVSPTVHSMGLKSQMDYWAEYSLETPMQRNRLTKSLRQRQLNYSTPRKRWMCWMRWTMTKQRARSKASRTEVHVYCMGRADESDQRSDIVTRGCCYDWIP